MSALRRIRDRLVPAGTTERSYIADTAAKAILQHTGCGTCETRTLTRPAWPCSQASLRLSTGSGEARPTAGSLHCSIARVADFGRECWSRFAVPRSAAPMPTLLPSSAY